VCVCVYYLKKNFEIKETTFISYQRAKT